jgi:hypothetical protein
MKRLSCTKAISSSGECLCVQKRKFMFIRHGGMSVQGFTDRGRAPSPKADAISIHNSLSSLRNLRDLSLLSMMQNDSAVQILNSISALQITHLWFGYVLNVESKEDCMQVLQPLRQMPCLVKMFLNFIDENWDPTSDTDAFYDMVLGCFSECGRPAWMFRTHI